MRKGIGPNNLGAPKGVGKQAVGEFLKDVAKTVGLGGAATVVGKMAKKKTDLKKQITTGRPNKLIEQKRKEKIGQPEERGEIIKVGRAKKLTRTPVEPVNELRMPPMQKLGKATPRSDAKLQKLKPAKPKPQSQVAKPKKVKIKVKPNKTKIKIKN